MQEFPPIRLDRFRYVLRERGCQWSTLAAEFDGMLFAIECGERFYVLHLFNTAPDNIVPYNQIRAVCTALDLGPEIFLNDESTH